MEVGGVDVEPGSRPGRQPQRPPSTPSVPSSVLPGKCVRATRGNPMLRLPNLALLVCAAGLATATALPVDIVHDADGTSTNGDTPLRLRVGSDVVNTVNPTYASFNIDASYNRGFFHIDFSNENLAAAVRSLRPATLRFGGTGNDFLRYGTARTPCPANANYSDTYGCLNETHWRAFHTMATANGADFLFGVSFDKATACLPGEGLRYQWNDTNVADFLETVVLPSRQTLWGVELGNEVNNDELLCNLTAAQQGAAIVSLAATLRKLYPDAASRPVQIGPDTGHLLPQAWLQTVLTTLEDHSVSLHAVTHHVYPGVRPDNYNAPSTLDRIHSDIAWYLPVVRQFGGGAQAWAGEDGPITGGIDGTCLAASGGVASACGTYMTVLWYTDDLGQRAKAGFTQYQRQDLVGGRYGLLGIPHDNEALAHGDLLMIHPDFWITFLWKRVMGSAVLNTTLPDDYNGTLRVYAHQGPAPSPFAHSRGGDVGFALLNLDSAKARSVVLTPQDHTDRVVQGTTSVWTLTPGPSGPATAEARMNGVLLPAHIAHGKGFDDPPVAAVQQSASAPLELPPLSVTFAVWSPAGTTTTDHD